MGLEPGEACSVSSVRTDPARPHEVHLRPPELRHEPFVERWSIQIASAFSTLNELVQTPFAAGDRFTQADVTLGVRYDMYRPMHPELLPVDTYPNLHRLAEKYHAMPVFQQSALKPL